MRKRNPEEEITESMSRDMTGELIAGGHDPDWSIHHVAKRMKQAQDRDLERRFAQAHGGQYCQFSEPIREVGQSNGHDTIAFEASCTVVCSFDDNPAIHLPPIILKSHQPLKEQLVYHLDSNYTLLQKHGYWKEDDDAEHRFDTKNVHCLGVHYSSSSSSFV